MDSRKIVIDPVTRVEGHGKIEIQLDESGRVVDAVFGVTEFRGFEKFCEGRMLWDMPTIMDRICGFCPVSHHLASVKACEALLGVEPPPGAVKLRELLHIGQFIHSHALHFFFCALPDTLFTDHASRADRNLFGLLDQHRTIAGNAIKIRKAGQNIVDIVGGGRIHPVACIPGGMSKALSEIERVEMLKGVLGSIKIAQQGLKLIKELYQRSEAVFKSFAMFPSSYMSMVKDNKLELYDGHIRVIDQDGELIQEYQAAEYLQVIEERVEPASWTKYPYLKERGYPKGSYRVASLARLNIAQAISTPLAQEAFKEYREIGDGKPISAGLFYHYARMIELLYAVERARELLTDAVILSHEVRVPVKRRGGEGIGALEAPRGLLFHHYWADENGRVQKVNLVVATAHNHAAINYSVRQVAEKIVKDGEIKESELNKLEMAVRCYDPCLSCSSHAWGAMPLLINIYGYDGHIISTYHYGDENA